jgi:outer membrane biosynthesis protein TonB
VREESHLDDMRAAIRGDFERLQERLGEQELMRLDETPVPEPQEAEAVVPEAEPEPASEPDYDPSPPDVVQDAPATEPEPRGEAAEIGAPEPAAQAEEDGRSWLDRLLGR